MVKSEPVTPLGRPKATKSLGGLVEPEPLPRLLICIKPEPHLKRGLYLSHHAKLHGVVLFKAASGLPLDICFLYITGGLGRVRTNVTPLDLAYMPRVIWGPG